MFTPAKKKPRSLTSSKHRSDHMGVKSKIVWDELLSRPAGGSAIAMGSVPNNSLNMLDVRFAAV